MQPFGGRRFPHPPKGRWVDHAVSISEARLSSTGSGRRERGPLASDEGSAITQWRVTCPPPSRRALPHAQRSHRRRRCSPRVMRPTAPSVAPTAACTAPLHNARPVRHLLRGGSSISAPCAARTCAVPRRITAPAPYPGRTNKPAASASPYRLRYIVPTSSTVARQALYRCSPRPVCRITREPAQLEASGIPSAPHRTAKPSGHSVGQRRNRTTGCRGKGNVALMPATNTRSLSSAGSISGAGTSLDGALHAHEAEQHRETGCHGEPYPPASRPRRTSAATRGEFDRSRRRLAGRSVCRHCAASPASATRRRAQCRPRKAR